MSRCCLFGNRVANDGLTVERLQVMFCPFVKISGRGSESLMTCMLASVSISEECFLLIESPHIRIYVVKRSKPKTYRNKSNYKSQTE
eukprot:2156832-Pleurochrysis_carterae.AAC.1